MRNDRQKEPQTQFTEYRARNGRSHIPHRKFLRDPTKTYLHVCEGDILTAQGPVKPLSKGKEKEVPRSFIEYPLLTIRQIRDLRGFKHEDGISDGKGGMVWHNQYHHFVQHQLQGSVPGVGFSSSFALNQISEASALAGIFDQYKLERIELICSPVQNFSQLPVLGAAVALNSELAPLLEAPDFDDATVPTTIGVLESKALCKMHSPMDGTFVREFVPMVALAAYSGAFTSFVSVPPEWIDMASPGVLHYGWKVWMTPTEATQTVFPQWNILTKYYFAFRYSQ